MRKAKVSFHGEQAGILEEIEKNRKYRFTYDDEYKGSRVSLTMPTGKKVWEYDTFPPFFEGLLPEGFNLEALLRIHKIDPDDCFSQLAAVGADLPGAVTVAEIVNQEN
ncbi:MAG: toxin HipA [Desulfobacterales bacterium]|nr:toxin HipA [Desulfobacterales bacterium]